MPGQHERSVPEVLHSIVGNIQDMVRSEFRLAKTEIKEEVAEAGKPAVALGTGLVLAVYAVGLVLLTMVFVLAMFVATWMAALAVGLLTAAAAAIFVSRGISGFKNLNVTPDRTIASLKENIRWATKSTR